MKISCDNLSAKEKHYYPVAMGNGDLAFDVDYEGVVPQREFESLWQTSTNPGIRRAGFRYDSSTPDLIPLGWFGQEIAGSGEPVAWTQTLDIDNGMVECRCEYTNGMTVESEIFCHLQHNVIAIRKRIIGGDQVDFTFQYCLGTPKRMQIRCEGDRIAYNVDEGQYEGVISLWSDVLTTAGDGMLRGNAREFTVFLAFGEPAIAWAKGRSFDELFSSHRDAWKAYWDESYIRIPDKKMEEAYYASQYHLRISSTKWSIPTRVHNAFWQGRYFGFDEYFAFRGLVSSGHMDIARKVPEFRYSILDVAKKRSSGYSPEVENDSAKYTWSTLEDGREGAPGGIWLEHIFHMASIALGCYDDYIYSGDLDFLRAKGYPVIRACTLFFDLMAVNRRPDGSVIVGKCTDLERLGAGRENAFMTTCGVIATCNAAVHAARSLGVDADLVLRWHELSAALKATLPHDGKKYLPYPGCPQKSMAVFSGLFPYPALSPDNPKLINATDDFDQAGDRCGNMYPGGKGICAWYAAWKAIYYARSGKSEKAYELLKATVEDTGCFSEIFEIYEFALHPWFTTAEGIYVQAVNELLLQVENDGTIKTAPAVPMSWKNYAFKLQGFAGKKIEIECLNGVISGIG